MCTVEAGAWDSTDVPPDPAEAKTTPIVYGLRVTRLLDDNCVSCLVQTSRALLLGKKNSKKKKENRLGVTFIACEAKITPTPGKVRRRPQICRNVQDFYWDGIN